MTARTATIIPQDEWREIETGRSCFGCRLLSTFTPRPDERERYGFGDVGYGCKELGFEGYVDPEWPICIRGPYLPNPPEGGSL